MYTEGSTKVYYLPFKHNDKTIEKFNAQKQLNDTKMNLDSNEQESEKSVKETTNEENISKEDTLNNNEVNNNSDNTSPIESKAEL